MALNPSLHPIAPHQDIAQNLSDYQSVIDSLAFTQGNQFGAPLADTVDTRQNDSNSLQNVRFALKPNNLTTSVKNQKSK